MSGNARLSMGEEWRERVKKKIYNECKEEPERRGCVFFGVGKREGKRRTERDTREEGK